MRDPLIIKLIVQQVCSLMTRVSRAHARAPTGRWRLAPTDTWHTTHPALVVVLCGRCWQLERGAMMWLLGLRPRHAHHGPLAGCTSARRGGDSAAVLLPVERLDPRTSIWCCPLSSLLAVLSQHPHTDAASPHCHPCPRATGSIPTQMQHPHIVILTPVQPGSPQWLLRPKPKP